jgi:hypothetical protein
MLLFFLLSLHICIHETKSFKTLIAQLHNIYYIYIKIKGLYRKRRVDEVFDLIQFYFLFFFMNYIFEKENFLSFFFYYFIFIFIFLSCNII